MRVGLIIGLLIGALVLAGVAFAQPWLPPPQADSPMLERYAPLKDGDAFFLLARDADGKPLYRIGRTVELLSTSRALAGEVSQVTRDALEKFVLRPGENEIDSETLVARLDMTRIYRQTDRLLRADGTFFESELVVVRDSRGETVISSLYPQSDLEVVFDPPLLSLPASFNTSGEWESAGMSGLVPYALNGRVVSYDAATDCWTIESVFRLTSETRSESDYCSGKGVMATRSFDANGVLSERLQVFFRDQPLAVGTLDALPLETDAPLQTLDTNFENWTLTRLRRVGRNISAGEATIPPLWLPTNPPSVLASGYLGSFFAYEANDPAAAALWSFPVEGTVYSPPAYDAVTGRVYFGASDKRLYALDGRGLFLWSFLARDNIAARPLVTGDLVIFGSEDRNVYAVNSARGELVWRAALASPIVSSAAFGNGNVVVGSDDGTVYVLDVKTGATRWTFGADDAVQAPIVVHDETAYAASRGGTLFALNVTTGAEQWRAEMGAALNDAPLVSEGRIYVVAGDGTLHALDATNGSRVWQTGDMNFSGTPLALPNALIVPGSDGNVYRLDLEGNVQQTWSGAEVSNAYTSFQHAPVRGDDAIWLVDDRAGLWRLGTPRAQIAALNPVWVNSYAEAPFQQFPLTTSPTAYGERAVILDEGSNIYLVDPQTGGSERVGQIVSGSAQATRLDSIVADDTLFTVIGNTLYATNLRDGTEQWQANGTAATFRPVTVTDDTVLWTQMIFDFNGSAVVQGTLTALDRLTGEARWQNELHGSGYPSGVTARDGVVYTAESAAYDLATGEELWRSTFDGWTAGEPVLSADGQVLFVPASRTETGMLLALNARDGSLLWQQPTSTNTPNFVEPAYRAGDALIVSGLNGTIAALNAVDGTLRWTFEPPAPRLGNLYIEEDRVWMILQDGRVIAVDSNTGALAAQFSDLDLSLTGGVTQHPLMMDDTVLVPYRTLLLGLRQAP